MARTPFTLRTVSYTHLDVYKRQAKAYGTTLADVQHANMLLGDVGETVRLASVGKLAETHMRLFHPLGFMLASPIDSPEEGLSYFAEAVVEDKYDGIRAQAHVSGDEVKIFSRARDDITESFPELPQALAGLPQDAILDGEIVAWHYPKGLSETKQVVDEAPSEASEQKAINLGQMCIRDRNHSILEGVVSGVASYGNCFGVPNLGGETKFESCYSGNPLVNAFALGLVRKNEIFYACLLYTSRCV